MFAKKRVFAILTILGLVLTACGGAEATQQPVGVLELPILQLAMQVDTSVPFTAVGQVANISLSLTNSGNGSISGSLTWVGATPTCPTFNTTGNLNDTLDPSEKIVCQLGYSLTQADLDRGAVSIPVTASLNGINSNQVIIAFEVLKPKAVTLNVTANPVTYSQVGQQIIFTYVIKNSGSQNLGPTPPFTITDNLLGTTPFNCGASDVTLAPGTTVSCSATYTITQADLSAASITNLATASGGGASASAPATATLNKGAVTSSLTPGSTIQHKVIEGEWLWQIARCYGVTPQSIIQANTQLVNPHQLKPDTVLTIPNIGSASTPFGPPCVVSHTVTAQDTWSSIAQLYNADIAILQMVNNNTLTVGSKIKVPRNSAGGTVTPPVTQTKTLTVTTTANPLTYEQAGQQITLTYTIKNSGNVTLGPAPFSISDSLISPTPFSCGDANATLAPGASLTCSVIYTITQADLNAVSITSVATASGGGASPSPLASVTIHKGVRSLSLNVEVSAATYNQANQQVTFKYTIQNTGNVAIGPTQFTVTDTLISPNAFNCGDANTTLAPGALVTCTATYTITQADMNAASVSNFATASGGGVGPTSVVSKTINKQ